MPSWCSFVNSAARQTVGGFSFSRLTSTGARIHLGMASSHILLTTIFIIASSIIHTKGLKCYEKVIMPKVPESPVKETECDKSNTHCFIFDGDVVAEKEKTRFRVFYQACYKRYVFNCTNAGPEHKGIYMKTPGLMAEGNLKCCKEDLCNKGKPSAVDAKPAEGQQAEKGGTTTHKAGDKEDKGGQKTSKSAGTKEAKGGATTAKSEEEKSGATTPKSEGVGAKVWILTLGGMMVVACIF